MHTNNQSVIQNVLTQWRGVVFGKDFVFGSVGIEVQQVVQVADAIGQRSNGEVFGCVRHEVPHHSFSCEEHTRSYVDNYGRSRVTFKERFTQNHLLTFMPLQTFMTFSRSMEQKRRTILRMNN